MRYEVFFLWFTMPIVVGCAHYDINKNTPIFLDTKQGIGRIYKAEKTTPQSCGAPDYLFKYSNQNIPIKDMSGYVCLSPDQVQYNLRYYNEFLKQQANCQ